MNNKNPLNAAKRCFIVVIISIFAIVTPCISLAEEIEAITRPTADIELSFVQPGKIHEIKVNEGAMVKEGDLLMRQEDTIEMIQYRILTARAKNTTRIEIAEAKLQLKEKDFEKMKSAQKKGAITDWEVDHASLDLETALLDLQLAKFEHEQDILKQEEIKAVLDNLHLKSPANGIVEETKVDKGESVQALSPVLRIVTINPLFSDVAVPVSEAKLLTVNQKVTVKYSDGMVSEGYVENISSVADAAAATLRVRVKVSNPTNRPAGERVAVNFSRTEK